MYTECTFMLRSAEVLMLASTKAWTQKGFDHSVFVQAHLAPVKSTDEVEKVMATLLTNGKIQRATHNIMAYRMAVLDKDTFLQVRSGICIPGGLQSLCDHGTQAWIHVCSRA